MEKQLRIHVSSIIKEPLKEGDEFLIETDITGDPQLVGDMLLTVMDAQFRKGNGELATIIVSVAQAFLKKYPDVMDEIDGQENQG